MIALLKYLATTVESDPGTLSTTRVVVLFGTLVVVFTACGVFALSIWTGNPIPEVPLSTSTFVLTLLGTLLGTKLVQSHQENKAPPTNP